jgi:CheY-like chemotaxis protein/CHASE3 domain sensor protein
MAVGMAGRRGNSRQLALNRWVLLAIIPLFLLLAAGGVLSVRFAMHEHQEQHWVVHTYQVIDRLQSVLSDIQAAETAQRGYLLTRQGRFLAPYRSGIARAHLDLDAFEQLTLDNPVQKVRAAALRSLMEARFRALDQTLTAGATDRAVSPETLSAMDEGRIRMDSVRAELARGMAEEQSLLATRLTARHRAEQYEVFYTAFAALIALAILLGTAVLLIVNNSRLARSQRMLEAETASLQTTLDTIRDGIAMFTADGVLRAFNRNFFAFLDLPLSLAHKGVTLAELGAAADAGNGPLLDAARAESGATFCDATLNGRDLEIYRAPVPTGGFIIACADVTARVQAEQAARQAQKMEAVGHLTGGVAHDFNNLLQIIGASLDGTARDGDGDPKRAERIQNALNAVARGARLTGQLLAFARRQTLDPRSTNIGRVIQEMTDLLRRTLGERIEVECIVAGGLWNTLVDPGQIENAILNLAINARDAMPAGGKLTIEVANAFLDDAYVAQHGEVVAGQYVMVGISDTGMGMAPEVAARAFEPFFTTKAEGHGTGLGLSQVYGFVKQSGGHIKIYSEVGHGTTIKLYLPRTRKPQEGVGPVTTGPVEGGTERVLVVEDDNDVRAAAVEMLGNLGYRVLKAANAEQALTVLASGAPVDLLFTDVVMPGPIGVRELARRARELRPNLAVLYTSGYTQNAIVHNGRLDDDVSLLSKPYRREDLARKVRVMLNDKRPSVQGSVSATTSAPAGEAWPKVLVVEDIALIRMTTVDMVQETGFPTAEAADGAEALSRLQADPEIAILLTDLGLPGMTGQQLVNEAQRINSGLKIIVASGYSSDHGSLPPNAIQLMKPFDLQALRRALEAEPQGRSRGVSKP